MDFTRKTAGRRNLLCIFLVKECGIVPLERRRLREQEPRKDLRTGANSPQTAGIQASPQQAWTSRPSFSEAKEAGLGVLAMAPDRRRNVSNSNTMLGLAVSLIVVFGAVLLGGSTVRTEVGEWYEGLNKPGFTPPNWLFGPVWTVLYLAMAVAAWLVWRRGGFGAHKWALGLFILQLVLNAAWSPVFFGMHRIGAALVVIILLWAAILATMVAFFRVAALAGWLFVPYHAWVTFATILNFALWRLNAAAPA